MGVQDDRSFLIGGYDVSKYVLDLENASGVHNKPEWGDMPEVPRMEFNLLNNENQFSAFSNNSLLGHQIVQNLVLSVFINQGSSQILEWTGFVENAIEDYNSRTVRISGISNLAKKIDNQALISTLVDTPSELSKTLFELYDIEVDSSSYSRANNALSGFVSCQVDPNLTDSNITLFEIQKQLAIAGYGRVYYYDGKMFYDVFSTQTPTISFGLTEEDIMSHPEVTREERQPTSYKVDYLDGFADSAGFVSGSPQSSLSFGVNNPVKITSLSGAQQVGDQWENISKENKIRISFGIKHEIGYILNLQSYINLTWEGGGFSDEPLEIVSIDRTDDRYTTIVGRTL